MSVLADVLREAARRFGEREALVHDALRFSYAALDSAADEVAAGLAARGIGAGDLVALVLPTGAEFVVAYLGLARLGAVTTGVSSRYTALERAKVLERARPAVVLATEELGEHIPAGPEIVRCIPASSAADVWREIRRDGPPAPAPPTDDDALEAVVFTSGTTGAPKGAMFRSRQIRAITEMDTGGVWGAGGPQLVPTGLNHVGFMTKLAGHLKTGSTMHLLTRWRAADALRTIAEERMAVAGGIAAQIALMLQVPDFDRYDLRAVKGLIGGGGPSPPALVREARERFGAPYSIRYSSTESGGLGTMTAWDAPDCEVLETVGRPRPTVELQVRTAEDGAVLDPGEVGQVFLRSPMVMDGYWCDEQASAAALDAQGWLRTGDVGYLRDDGCLCLTGRMSEMYIRGGYNVHPQEVEAVLGEHPKVREVCVVARSDPVMGEIGVAVVVPTPGGAPPELEDLQAFGGRRLAAYKLPERMRVVDALPLTSMDKVDRRSLAEQEARPDRTGPRSPEGRAGSAEGGTS